MHMLHGMGLRGLLKGLCGAQRTKPPKPPGFYSILFYFHTLVLQIFTVGRNKKKKNEGN